MSYSLFAGRAADDGSSASLNRNLGRAQFGSQQSLPIFVFPTSLTFYATDGASHKQVMTLYNPYDFPLQFQVLSTSPQKYTVADSDGILKERNCVDIVIRHMAALNPANLDVVDKFRIQVSEHGSSEILGRKDVPSTLLEHPEPDTLQDLKAKDVFQQLSGQSQDSSSSLRNRRLHSSRDSVDVPSSVSRSAPASPIGSSFCLILIAIFCVTGLSLPTVYSPSSLRSKNDDEGDSSDRSFETLIPDWLHLTVAQKLVCAYVLGLLTVVFLRQ